MKQKKTLKMKTANCFRSLMNILINRHYHIETSMKWEDAENINIEKHAKPKAEKAGVEKASGAGKNTKAAKAAAAATTNSNRPDSPDL
jgi:hypothetical protein